MRSIHYFSAPTCRVYYSNAVSSHALPTRLGWLCVDPGNFGGWTGVTLFMPLLWLHFRASEDLESFAPLPIFTAILTTDEDFLKYHYSEVVRLEHRLAETKATRTSPSLPFQPHHHLRISSAWEQHNATYLDTFTSLTQLGTSSTQTTDKSMANRLGTSTMSSSTTSGQQPAKPTSPAARPAHDGNVIKRYASSPSPADHSQSH